MAQLKDRHRVFVREYLTDLNATRAAIAAGYSPKSAKQTGSNLLSTDYIIEAINEVIDERTKRLDITADDVCRELWMLGRSDIKDFVVNTDGSLGVAEGVSESATRCVQSFKNHYTYNRQGEVTGGKTEIRMHNKIDALRLLAQHLDMLGENKAAPKKTPDEKHEVTLEDDTDPSVLDA